MGFKYKKMSMKHCFKTSEGNIMITVTPELAKAVRDLFEHLLRTAINERELDEAERLLKEFKNLNILLQEETTNETV